MAVQKSIATHAAIVAIGDLRALSAESLIITMKESESALEQTSQIIAAPMTEFATNRRRRDRIACGFPAGMKRSRSL